MARSPRPSSAAPATPPVSACTAPGAASPPRSMTPEPHSRPSSSEGTHERRHAPASRLAPVTDEQAASALVSRQALGELGEDIIRSTPHQPAAAPALLVMWPVTPTRRRLTWAAASAVAVGAAAAVAVIASGGQPATGGQPGSGGKTGENAASGSSQRPSPTSSTTLTAWTVTENRDGTLSVTIREMEDPSGLQATLRADGARVVVTASLAWPASCKGEWRGGNYHDGRSGRPD